MKFRRGHPLAAGAINTGGVRYKNFAIFYQ